MPPYTTPADIPRLPASVLQHSVRIGSIGFVGRDLSVSRQRTQTARDRRCLRRAFPSSSSCHAAIQYSTSFAPVFNQHRAKPVLCASAAAAESTAAPPTVTSLHSAQEFQDVIEQNPGRLIVLMCKAQGCRPCKMFGRKFQRLAEQFQDAIFLDIIGDETNDTRRLMIKLEVKATPTFFLYRDQRLGNTLTGINENNLRNAIIDYGHPSDQDHAPLE